jgi:hypothetical protein
MPFNQITGMLQWHADTVLVADAGNNALYKYSCEDGGITVLARSGAGPGEVENPYFLAPTPDGGFATFSVRRQGLDTFDDQGFFVARTELLARALSNPKGLAVLADGTFIIAGGIFGSGLGVHQFGQDGRSLRSWAPNPGTANPAASLYMAGGPVTALDTGGFIYSNASPHKIIQFDRDFRETVLATDAAILTNPGDDFMYQTEVDGQKVTAMRWWYPQSTGVFKLEDGSTLNVITRRNDARSIWEIWSPAGTLVHRRSAPVAYRPWSMTDRSTVLATYEDPNTREHVAVELQFETTFHAAPMRPRGCGDDNLRQRPHVLQIGSDRQTAGITSALVLFASSDAISRSD